MNIHRDKGYPENNEAHPIANNRFHNFTLMIKLKLFKPKFQKRIGEKKFRLISWKRLSHRQKIIS